MSDYRTQAFAYGDVSGVVRERVGADVVRARPIYRALASALTDGDNELAVNFADCLLLTSGVTLDWWPRRDDAPDKIQEAYEAWCNINYYLMAAWLTAINDVNEPQTDEAYTPDADAKN
jgi:hypothetical protein